MYFAQRIPIVKSPNESGKERHRHDLNRPQRSPPEAASGADNLLPPENEPPLGAHLITPRFAYEHHGVYMGGGMVVHYAAFAKHWRCGPVEEISLGRFAQGQPVWVRPPRGTPLESAEILKRARSRLGENRYGFLSNNCEHLSEWCVNGEHRSLQVERLLAPLHCISVFVSSLLRDLPLRLRSET